MTVLSETTHRCLTSQGIIMFTIGLILLFIAAITVVSVKYEVFSLVFVIVGLTLILLSFAFCTEPCKQIKATISDSYSADALYENYKVVGRDGKIWILDERN